MEGADTEYVGAGHWKAAVYTCPLPRGDLVLPADQLISNLLTRTGKLKFKKIQICM